MKACLNCLPCLGRNAVDAAKRSTDDPALQRKIMSESLHLLADADLNLSPPHLAGKILEIARRLTGKSELYEAEKKRSNQLAERLLGELPKLPEYHPDEFESRLRLAVAGNILDFGIFSDLNVESALEAVKSALVKPLDREAVERVRLRMENARHILYILDNSGEAVFDRVFMEPYRDKITLVVRGQPVFNDVTAADLPDCGLDGWTWVDSGPKGYPGTILSETREPFRQLFSEADLVIAKGQGNFETLNETRVPTVFLFLAKCPVVTALLHAEINSIQVRTVNF